MSTSTLLGDHLRDRHRLLAVTGMGSGEALRLDRDHLDWDEGVLTVWYSKFQNSRALPLHPTTMKALRNYAQLRDELCPHPNAPSFFITTTGNRSAAASTRCSPASFAAPASTIPVDGPAHMT